ncbi:MAG: CBS domain-containing protein [Crocinitomicaceae bacterium]|nr:CBS domain-containing protein [Crocinitomicaceae bacterium]MDG1658613.1 CBS domain-containing protein [Crocinitomicaceae bacterium]MDG2440868.1 CBS domain-containing protein [Crocinitomicaceae bacterium]|tara:strand:+ start:1422 stop:2084 length:663 start_codon:yes stop_codon:yes gene_type:complete
MIAIDLITDEIPPLMHSDTGEKALNWMEEFKVSHLPVLKSSNFVGVVSESILLDQADLSLTLDKLFQHLPRPFANVGDHIYQVLARISEYRLSLIPILDNDEKYVGCAGVHHLLTLVANTGSIKEVGGILVVEMSKSDYSMAQIGQIVESNDAKILSSYIMSSSDSTNIEVTLKINTLELDRIIRTFERYDYVIKASFQKSRYGEDLQFRYDALINYLNL